MRETRINVELVVTTAPSKEDPEQEENTVNIDINACWESDMTLERAKEIIRFIEMTRSALGQTFGQDACRTNMDQLRVSGIT